MILNLLSELKRTQGIEAICQRVIEDKKLATVKCACYWDILKKTAMPWIGKGHGDKPLKTVSENSMCLVIHEQLLM